MPRFHDDFIKWKHFPRYWPFVRGIHRSPVNYLHRGHWRGDLMFSLICTRINGWVNNGEAGDLRRYRAHYDVTVMLLKLCCDSLLNSCEFMVASLILHQPLRLPCGPFYWHWWNLIPPWISNNIYHKVWDKINYPFPNFNGAAAELWKWISNFMPRST